MAGDLLGYALLALVGLALSALYSGLETGLYTINRVRLLVRATHGDQRAARLRDLIQHPNRMLSTILLGNNAANYAGSFGLAAILDHLGFTPVQTIIVNAAILIPILFIFGETLPKDLFRTYTDLWSYTFSGFLTWSARLLTWTGLSPITQGFGMLLGRVLGSDATAARTARQRISHLIREGVGAGVLSEHQTTLADRALAMRELTAGNEMVPWRQVNVIREDADADERQRTIDTCLHTRVPVVDRHGNVVGIVSLLDLLLEPDRSIKDVTQKTMYLDPRLPVRDALRRMQAERCPMAIVVRPGTKQPIGIVTVKDLVEPLTGELAAW